jgi:hypothetical protein
MGKLDALGGRVRQTIRAFHGTPHPEDVLARGLDPRRIGSSNGTAEGHGYYFSEDRALSRWYGEPLAVEIDVPRRSIADWYSPVRSQGDLLDRFAQAVKSAPDNKWKQDAFAEMMRRDGQAHLAYQSLLRAHNVGDGAGRLGRYEAGRRASEALREHGVLGGRWVDEMTTEPGAANYLLFPGVEDSIRILRRP